MGVEFQHELVIPNEDLPFKLFVFEGKDGGYRRAKHWHRSVEIFLVLEGELVFMIDDVRFPLKAVDLMIVNSNEIHSIEAPLPNNTIVLQIPVSCFFGYLEEDQAVFAKQSREAELELSRLVLKIYQCYQEKGEAYGLEILSLFYRLLYLLVTRFKEAEPDQRRIKHKRDLDKLSQITAYMKKNYDQELSLESVADHFGFSPTSLSRMFRRYADVTYKTYLLDLRTRYALREMMNTDHSLSDVALNNGFPNSRAFAKAFMSRYGCLPSVYRQRREMGPGHRGTGDGCSGAEEGPRGTGDGCSGAEEGPRGTGDGCSGAGEGPGWTGGRCTGAGEEPRASERGAGQADGQRWAKDRDGL